MTFYAFRLLAAEEQLHHALSEGAYLAQRWESQYQGLNLYHLDDGGCGFFVEVGVDEVAECITLRRSFRNVGPLEGYVLGVRLPEGWA